MKVKRSAAPGVLRARRLPWDLPVRGIAVRLFITCWLVYAAHFATNTVREIYPALSLGDHLSFDVSEYAGLHPDIFELEGQGTFINNNPGASMLGAVPYAVARPAIGFISDRVQSMRGETSVAPSDYESPFPLRRQFYAEAYERGLDIKFGLAAGVMQVLLMAPLSALSAVVMFYVLLRLTSSKRAALVLALLYAFATPVFYRTAQLNHNLLVSHFAFFSFVLLWRPWDKPGEPKRPRYLLAGLLCGFTVVLDYTGLIAVLCLSAYALVRWLGLPQHLRPRSDLALFALGVAACGVVLMWYQWASFGHPLYPAQHYMPPTQFSDYGYSGIDWPNPDLLWRTAIGLKFGLFSFAPLLLLALYVPAWFDQRLRIIRGRETALVLVFTAGLFLFASASQYGYMQFNSGVRYVVPAVPFLFLLAAGVLLRMRLALAVAIGAVTAYWSWCLAMYREVGLGLGVIEALVHIHTDGFQLPWLTTLEYLDYAPGVLVYPILLLLGAVLWALWRHRLPREQAAYQTRAELR